MADVQGAASFNPDDASGLLDNARVKITALVVDFFTATKGKNAGSRFVNADVTFEGGGQKVVEHYMIGGADQWAPNASKTGVLPVVEGGKIWNKSDVHKLITSLVNSGFPKALVGADLSVFVGLDVHVNRVTQEGQTYMDKEGKERVRTTLLVTKLYTDMSTFTPGTATAGKATTKATAKAATGGATTDEHDALLTEMLVEILTESGNATTKDKLPQPVFIKATRGKKTAIRQQLQERIVSDAFLGTLVEAGLIAVDGANISLAT